MPGSNKLLVGAALVLGLALAVGGCGESPKPTPPPERFLEPVPESQWPLIQDDMDPESLAEACRHSQAYLAKVPAGRGFAFGDHQVAAAELAAGLARLVEIRRTLGDPQARTQAMKREFLLFKSVGSDGRGAVLMTGYYEPVITARRNRQGAFGHPLYAQPDDMIFVDLKAFGEDLPPKRLVGVVRERQVVPYPDREAIDYQGALAGKAVVLAWVEDPVDAFFLQVQGSGQVVFPDGGRLRLGYAAANGRPYRSIGGLLIREGFLDKDSASMQSIKKYLAEHPEERRRVLSHNPSYVFFRSLPAGGGPLGCYEQPLTAGRSIATDRRVFPGLTAAFVRGTRPGPGGSQVPLARVVLNQDTGGAIRGAGRLDLYFGGGDEAGELAGRMKHPGELYFLAPRPRR